MCTKIPRAKRPDACVPAPLPGEVYGTWTVIPPYR